MNIPGKPTDIAEFDPALLSLSIPPPRADTKSAKYGSTYFLQYKDGPARFLLPVLRSPFGIQPSELDDAQTLQLSLELTSDKRPELNATYEKMVQLQETIFKLVVANKSKLYKGNPTEDVLQSKYTPFIKLSDKNYPPSIRAIVETDFNDREKVLSLIKKPLLIDENKQPIPVTRSTISSVVGRNSNIKPVLEIKHLFVSNKGSTTNVKWRLSHAKVISSDGGDGVDWDMDDKVETAPTPAAQEAEADDSDGDGSDMMDDSS